MQARHARVVLLGFLWGACAAPPAARDTATFPSPAALRADSLRTERIGAGVTHTYLWDAAGPWGIHLLEVDPRACGVEIRSVKAGDRLVGRATTSALALEAEARWERPVLGAINADFFSFDPPGVPIGAQVVEGEVVKGPAERPVFGLTRDGTPFIEEVRLSGEVRTAGGFAAPLTVVNTAPAMDGVALYNRFIGDATPDDSSVVEVRLRPIGGAGREADTLIVVVVDVDTFPAGVALPDGGAVLAGRGRSGHFLGAFVAPGDTLTVWVAFSVPRPVAEMVGGFPRLLRSGEPVHQLDPAVRAPFGAARHPRTAIGWRADGTLLLVVVDGRQPPYSEGMSLAELANLLRRIGAVEALNLDGGGSTTMVVAGRVVNRPSDAAGERANANALVVLGPSAGSCP